MSAKTKQKTRFAARRRRHVRIRKKIWGTAERPRLVVFRSNRNMEGQLVDDDAGETITGLSTLAPELKGFTAEGENKRIEQAFEAGKLLAARAKEKGIATVIFDRGGYKYHGRIKAFADGAREGGLEF